MGSFNVANDNFSDEQVYSARLDAEHYEYQASIYPEDKGKQEDSKWYWEQYYKMSGQWEE